MVYSISKPSGEYTVCVHTHPVEIFFSLFVFRACIALFCTLITPSLMPQQSAGWVQHLFPCFHSNTFSPPKSIWMLCVPCVMIYAGVTN